MMFPTINHAPNFFFFIDPNTNKESVNKSLAKDLTNKQRFARKI